ncbi:MAG: DUF933 domain-containing protein [Gemmatimonadota bacterium]|nr:DUF933 domain-containing protein [Gemmatimonadota bacterium]
MRFGLAGFAGSGKTTLFNAMTGLDVPVGYGGEIRVGTVRVPDARLDFLSGVISPKKTTYATINLRDVPGEHGAGARYLSPKSLQEIRDREALCLVLRDFLNPALDTDPDPLGDLRAFHDECVLADLAVVERRLDRARKERADIREIDAFETMTAALEDGQALRLLAETELHRGFLKGYGLLTDLPLLVALNVEEKRAGEALDSALAAEAREMGGAAMVLSAGVESEIAALDPEDQADFLEDMGLSEPALARFIRAAYAMMDLVSFFTIGKDEVRAWTVRRGTVARTAAGCVHSDMERGFIRAEVIPYEVFARHGSEQAVKEAGLMRVEGRDYVVADGDLLHVRFNV